MNKYIKIKSFAQIFLMLSLTFVISLSLNSRDVYASSGCCEKTTDGNYCDYIDQNECELNWAPTSCEQTSFCGTGTCANVDGYCYGNYPKGLCLSNAGTFYSQPIEQVGECKLGCCLLGTSASYVTKSRCIEETSNYPDLEVDFRDNIANEQSCLDLARNSEQGCCVKGEGRCSYGAKSECSVESTFNGTGFYNDKYCSELPSFCDCSSANPELGGEGDLKNTGCLDNSDDVYWIDSCGNPEDVKEDCDYSQGTLCGDSDNNKEFTCESIDCDFDDLSASKDGASDGKVSPDVLNDEDGVIRNGETWCLWDYLDDKDATKFYGKDPVGARHYRSLCINGKELVEPCADFRKEFCFSSELEVPGVNKKTSEDKFLAARCLKNDKWQSCVDSCNTADPFTMKPEEYKRALEKDKECCSDISTRDCQWSGKCVPAIKPGYKFWENEGVDQCTKGNLECKATFVCPGWDSVTGRCNPVESAGSIFGSWALKIGLIVLGGVAAAVTGPVSWAAFLGGAAGAGGPLIIDEITKAANGGAKWHLVSGGECFSQNYLQGANNYCRSLGDCGADYNYLGGDLGLSYTGFTNTDFIDEELELTLADLGKDGDSELKEKILKAQEREDAFSKDDLDQEKLSKIFVDDLRFDLKPTSSNEDGIPGKFDEKPNWEDGKWFFDFSLTKKQSLDLSLKLTGIENDAGAWGKFLGVSLGFGALGAIGGLAAVGAPGLLTGLFTTPGLNVLATVPGFFSESLKIGGIFAGDYPGKQAVIEAARKVAETGAGETAKKAGEKYVKDAVAKLTSSNEYLLASDADKLAARKAAEEGAKQGGDELEKEIVKEAGEDAVSSVKNTWSSEFFTGVNAGMWVYTAYKAIDIIAQDTKEVPITTTCTPWQAPPLKEEDQCERCNQDYSNGENGWVDNEGNPINVNAFKKCSEYKCKSLGASCELINKGTEKESCVSLFRFDVNPPKIEPWEEGFSDELNFENENQNGFSVITIETGDDDKVEVYKNFIIGLKTDKPSQCKMSFNKGAKYEDMGNTFFGSNLYEYYHVQTMFYPKSKEKTETGEVKLTGGGDYELTVRCSDAAGNTNLNDYVIKFAVSDEPDLTAPTILGASVIVNNQATAENEIYITSGETKVPVTLFVNEPGECKYDFNNLEYKEMSKGPCAAGSINSLGSYDCKFTGDPGQGEAIEIQESKAGVTKFVYFKCKDTDNNFNKDAFRLTLKGSNNLSIEKLETEPLSINGEIKTSLSVVPVTLKVKTEDGAKLNGESICKYTQQESLKNNLGAMIQFASTGASLHEQKFDSLSTGQHTFYAGCSDAAGNNAFSEITFSLTSDVTPPAVVRAYKDDSITPASFNVQVNEDADCKDSTEGLFDYDTEGNLMTRDGNVHISSSEPSNLYFVICRDKFGNTMQPARIQFA